MAPKGKGDPRLVYKPHSVQHEGPVYARKLHPSPSCLGDHLSWPGISPWLVQPTRNSNAAGSRLFLLGLAPDGGCLAAGIAARAGELLPHLFTLTCALASHRQLFSVAHSGRLPRPGSYPASCPLECGLSSGTQKAPAITRPTWDNHDTIARRHSQ